MDLEQRSGRVGGAYISGNKRAPSTKADREGAIEFVLHVAHRIVTPVIDLFGIFGADHIPRGQHPAAVATRDPQKSVLQRSTGWNPGVEQVEKSEGPVGIDIHESGGNTAEGHAMRDSFILAIHDAASRLAEALSRKPRPLFPRNSAGKNSLGLDLVYVVGPRHRIDGLTADFLLLSSCGLSFPERINRPGRGDPQHGSSQEVPPLHSFSFDN